MGNEIVAVSLFATGRGGKFRFGTGTCKVNELRLVVASQGQRKGLAVQQLSLLRPRQVEGQLALDPKNNNIRFEETFAPVFYVDAKTSGKRVSRKCRSLAEAEVTAARLGERSTIKEVNLSDAVGIYAYGNPSPYQDRLAGDLMGALWGRLPKEQELDYSSPEEFTSWLTKCMQPGRCILDKKVHLLEIPSEIPEGGYLRDLGLQHPSSLSHWQKLMDRRENSLQHQLSTSQGAMRSKAMEKAGGRNRVQCLQLVTG